MLPQRHRIMKMPNSLIHLRRYLKNEEKPLKSRGKQVDALKSLGSNDQQIQIYQPRIKPIEDLLPRDRLNQEAINELQKPVKIEQIIKREDLLYKTGDTKKDTVHDFRKFKTKPSLGIGILNGIITRHNTVDD